MLPAHSFPPRHLVRAAGIAAVLILASCSSDAPTPFGPNLEVSLQASHLAARTLYAVAKGDANLRTIDPTTAATLTSVPITVDGLAIGGANGLATDPTTGALYALVKTGSERLLATIDPDNGVASVIGNPGLSLAGIAFSCSELYGVSGDGDLDQPESFFRIDKMTGAATLVTALGNGSDGETIGFNPDDGLMYHMSGLGDQNDTDGGEIFETIDLTTLVVTPVALSGDDYDEALALTYDSHGRFLVSADFYGSSLWSVTDGGVVTEIAPFGFAAKGLAFVPAFGCNRPPVADAGPDQDVEWTTADAGATTLDGSASTDPDGDALAYSWSEGGSEIATGVSPTVNLSLGVHTITLTVADGYGETDTDEVVINVEDTTPPTVLAALVPVDGKSLKSKKGLFTVEFSCADGCDPDAVPTAMLNDVPVENGQVVDLELKSKKSAKSKKSEKSKKSDKPVKMQAASFALVVECVDASGNVGSATAEPTFAEPKKSKKSTKG